MSEIERISPREAAKKLKQGAWLVCAYENEDKCNSIHIQGTLSIKDFRAKLSDIPLDKGIIFYCA
ncbi:MAG: rhodanese-like domain-containing protein [Thermodesulfobacteriota bacterium]